MKFIVRAATRADIPAMSRVQVETKRSCYLGFYPPELLMKMSKEKTAAAWRRNLFDDPTYPGSFALVAETMDREIVGLIIAGPIAEPDPVFTAEVYVLYILAGYQRHGIGRALIKRASVRLRNEGHENLIVWVLAANPARKFYESLKGAATHQKEVDLYGYHLPEVGYTWEKITGLTEIDDVLDSPED